MKLTPAYQILAAVTGLATTIVGMMPLQANSLSTVTVSLPQQQQLIARADTALARKLQGKPVVVDIYASWCPACRNIAPVLSQLKQQYQNKVNFVVLDVRDRESVSASMKMANKLGLTQFFNTYKAQTSTVAIIDPATGKIIKQFRNNADIAEYQAILDRSITEISKSK
jgi:thiol-disulfide isomerase/thioredoxin